MATQELIKRRAEHSLNRLIAVRGSLAADLSKFENQADGPKLCIYATGSLARLEATNASDLDAFFFLSGDEAKSPLSRIREVKILNAVVNASEAHAFPDFSNEGEYLKFLHIDDVIGDIGGREDDYNNALTARMLMILESTYLYNDELFRRFRETIIETYFKDFHDHARDFRPIFLLNDILRFWRTMCLNYENNRHWRQQAPEKSAKGHLANLKLRFSRLNICYSFIAHLFAKGACLSPANVIDTAELTPLDRLRDLGLNSGLASPVAQMLDEYAWFLEQTGRSKEAVLKWISNEGQRADAFAHSRVFVKGMGEIVRQIAEENGYLRYLII